MKHVDLIGMFDDLEKVGRVEEKHRKAIEHKAQMKALKSVRKVNVDTWLKYAEEGDFEGTNIEAVIHL